MPPEEESLPFPDRFLQRFADRALAQALSSTYTLGVSTALPYDQYTESLLLAWRKGALWRSLFEDIRIGVFSPEGRVNVAAVCPVFGSMSLHRAADGATVDLHVEVSVQLDKFGGDAAEVLGCLRPELAVDPYGSCAARLYVSQKTANPFVVDDNPLAWLDAVMSMSLHDQS